MSFTTDVSVVIPCYTEERWERLTAAIDSALAQDPVPAEVVVVVDYNDALADRLRAQFSTVTVLPNRFARGVSGARNTGVFHTRTRFAALLDDDAVATAGWLAGLIAPFSDTDVVGTGGAIHPQWELGRPGWFPDEFLWAVAATDPALATPRVVRNVWAASLAVRREVFDRVGGFRPDFGKIGKRYRPEDTDLCLRMSRASEGGRWVLTPDSVIEHPVSLERSRFRYLLSRCYEEGRGKVAFARLNGRDSLGEEQDYLRRQIPRAVLSGLSSALTGGGIAPALRSGAVVSGVMAAAIGATLETARRDKSATYTKRQTLSQSRNDS